MVFHQRIDQLIYLISLRLRSGLQLLVMLEYPSNVSQSPILKRKAKIDSRPRNLLRKILRKSVQLLQRIQPRNSPAILNPITKERRQHLNLLSRQKLWRKSLDNRRQIRNGFPANDSIVVVYVLAE